MLAFILTVCKYECSKQCSPPNKGLVMIHLTYGSMPIPRFHSVILQLSYSLVLDLIIGMVNKE